MMPSVKMHVLWSSPHTVPRRLTRIKVPTRFIDLAAIQAFRVSDRDEDLCTTLGLGGGRKVVVFRQRLRVKLLWEQPHNHHPTSSHLRAPTIFDVDKVAVSEWLKVSEHQILCGRDVGITQS